MHRHPHLQAGFARPSAAPAPREGSRGGCVGLQPHVPVTGCAADWFWICNDFSKTLECDRAVRPAVGTGSGRKAQCVGLDADSKLQKALPILGLPQCTEDSLDCKELYTYPRWPFGCGTVCTHPEGLQQLPLRLPTEV